VDDRAGVVSIEASDPVPYVASQPDPRTFVVEMRDVLAVGFADNFKVDPRVPITSVHVENARRSTAQRSRASASTSRSRFGRASRSSRNVIYVEADRLGPRRGGRHQRRWPFERHPRPPCRAPWNVHRDHADGDRHAS
jgi:hypothetical protein